eukprot:3895995-Prymnesium_polylepis.1
MLHGGITVASSTRRTRSGDTVTAKRSKWALSPGALITLAEGQRAVKDARMWVGSGSLSISGFVQWYTVVHGGGTVAGFTSRLARLTL